ncbi:Glycosyl transferase, family 29 [Corchorus olitorius]|uniref:Glycosyl transferase, family 29 n=1 Tax=Corchorus olitorius TaxID=93759 RepID=A0A1R3I3F4_9ROSI|nr:Glycosyl transferase, family 29 [Corchorus olitorius]
MVESKLQVVLSETPPYVPRQFGRCAVIGNSGDLLKTRFGREIDTYDVVIRENGTPIENCTEYVSKKSSFRLLNRDLPKLLIKLYSKVAGIRENYSRVLATVCRVLSGIDVFLHSKIYLFSQALHFLITMEVLRITCCHVCSFAADSCSAFEDYVLRTPHVEAEGCGKIIHVAAHSIPRPNNAQDPSGNMWHL